MAMHRAGHGRNQRNQQPDDTNTPLGNGCLSGLNRASVTRFLGGIPNRYIGGESMTSLWQIKGEDSNGEIEIHFIVGSALPDDQGQREQIAISLAHHFAQATGLKPIEISTTMGEALEQFVGVDE